MNKDRWTLQGLVSQRFMVFFLGSLAGLATALQVGLAQGTNPAIRACNCPMSGQPTTDCQGRRLTSSRLCVGGFCFCEFEYQASGCVLAVHARCVQNGPR
jgi:hypothetical protein